VEDTDVTKTRPSTSVVSSSPLDKLGEYEAQQRMRMNVITPDLRIISKDHYEATDVTASPSNYARPHWGIYSRAIHMRRGEKIEAYNNVVKIGKVPVFYVPYMIYDLQYRWPYYRTRIGSDNRQGFSWYNRIGWKFRQDKDENGDPIPEKFHLTDIFGDVDLRMQRGWGLGGDATYKLDNFLGKGEGHLRGYWIKETYTESKEDQRRSREDVEFPANEWSGYPGFTPALYANENRYMVEWWHRQRFTDALDLRMQTHWFSDRDFYKEYFRNFWSEDQEKLTNG
jgi:lipopolysaccharide assembly outer membrane protein LptD (OstA)